jgi:hypothetical protein
MKKIHFHSGGVFKMDSTKLFGKARTCQEILAGLRGDFK